MNNTAYPAIFRKQNNCYWVEFPDLPGCLTEGETLDEAILMAGDALHIWLTTENENSKLQHPSPLNSIKEFYKNDTVLLIKPQLYESRKARQYMLKSIIEDCIERKGYSAKEVAKILEMDFKYFNDIINGETVPTLAEANMIANLLEFEAELFYFV